MPPSASEDQGPQKATLLVYDPTTNKEIESAKIKCQFNPEKLRISKTLTWGSRNVNNLNAPVLTFGGGSSATFDLVLWFDTSEEGKQADVRTKTNQLLQLTLKGQGHKGPPTVRLVWGQFKTFRCVVTGVEIEYRLFLPTGIPVRAQATLHLKQAADGESGKLPFQNPSTRTEPRKTHRVQEGDRLDYLAYVEYGDAGQWREIAEANGLEDPLDLAPGQLLILPQRD